MHLNLSGKSYICQSSSREQLREIDSRSCSGHRTYDFAIAGGPIVDKFVSNVSGLNLNRQN